MVSNNSQWADKDISGLVDEFHAEGLRIGESAAEKRERLREDVKLIVEKCPNLINMRISLFGELIYLRVSNIYSGLLKLRSFMVWSLFSQTMQIYGTR